MHVPLWVWVRVRIVCESAGDDRNTGVSGCRGTLPQGCAGTLSPCSHCAGGCSCLVWMTPLVPSGLKRKIPSSASLSLSIRKFAGLIFSAKYLIRCLVALEPRLATSTTEAEAARSEVIGRNAANRNHKPWRRHLIPLTHVTSESSEFPQTPKNMPTAIL